MVKRLARRLPAGALALLLALAPLLMYTQAPAFASSLSIGTSTLTDGTALEPYIATLDASGGTAPYTWSLASGSTLPSGLKLSSSGALTGTPAAAGTSTFKVQVTDNASSPATVSALLSLTVGSSAPTWTAQSSGTTANLTHVVFVDDQHGFALAGTNEGGSTPAAVLGTSDGGATWTQVGSIIGDVRTLACTDTQHCWASGGNGSGEGVIWATTDGGATWTQQFTHAGGGFNSHSGLTVMTFDAAGDGYAVAGNGDVFAKPAGSTTWSQVGTSTLGRGSSLAFANASDGWAVSSTHIYATADGGKTWTAQTDPSSSTLYAVSFINASDGWAAGRSGTVLGTTDGGATWNVLTSGLIPTALTSVAFADGLHGWVAGGNGSVWATSDGGRSWTEQTVAPGGKGLAALAFPDASAGWVVGTSGTILAYSPAGTMAVSPTRVVEGSSGTLAFTYTAAQAGATAVELTVPSGWTAPSTDATVAGYTYASAGTVSISGQTVEVGGLALSGGGSVTITYGGATAPGVVGTDVFAAQATVGGTTTDLPSPSVAVIAPLAVGTSALTAAVANEPYVASLDALGGTAPYTWSLASGSTLPSGLSLSASGGLTGTPTAAGTSSFTVKVGNASPPATATASLSLTVGSSAPTWTAQSSGTAANLTHVVFVDDQHGFALAGTSGGSSSPAAVLATSDGGATWTQVGSISGDVHTLACTDTQHCWASGGNGKGEGLIWATTDGGAQWTQQFTYGGSGLGSSDGLPVMAFDAAGDGWALAGNGNVFSKPAGSTTWSQVGTAPTASGALLVFANAKDGWAVNGTLIRATVDGGATWTPQTDPVTSGFSAITFVSASDGWAVGSGGTVLGTTDGGATWTVLTSGLIPTTLNSVAFADTLHGWVAGNNGSVWATSDGGRSWTEQPVVAHKLGVRALAVPDASHVWGVGDSGEIVAATLPPVLDPVLPNSVQAGDTVTLSGSGFGTVAGSVYFNDSALPTMDVTGFSDTQATAKVPVALADTTVTAQVYNATTGLLSNAETFHATVPPPVLDPVSPTTVQVGGTVVFTGSGFESPGTVAGSVYFNGSALPTTDVTGFSDTQATAKVPVALADTTVTAQVYNATTGLLSNAETFQATAPPTVTSISPTSGTTAGGTSVTITGTDLSGATAVDFGSAAGTNVQVVSSTQITATSPAGSAGTVDVTVTTPGGTSATGSGDQFTYVAPTTSTTLYVSTSGSDTKGDGSATNPYKTIGMALSVAPAGGTVLVEKGTYTLSAPLTVSQDVYLSSDTSGGATAATTILDATGQENGIVISGPGAAGTTISGLTVENSLKAGIVAEATTNVTIAGDIVQGTDQSYAASNPTVATTSFTPTNADACSSGNDCEAVHLVGVTNSTVTGNLVQNNLDGGIYLTDESGPSTGNTISDNRSLNNAVDCGITLASHVPGHGVSNNTVTGNTSEGNGAAGIVLATPTGEVSNNTVSGNTVENNAAGGIVLHTHSPIATVSGNIIENNTISGNGPDPAPNTVEPSGIVLYAGGAPAAPGASTLTKTTITGNTITGEYFGIFVEDARPNTISGNTITNLTSGGALEFFAPVTLTLSAPATVAEGGTVTVSGAVYAGDGRPVASRVTVTVKSGGTTLASVPMQDNGYGTYSTSFSAPSTAGALDLVATPSVGEGSAGAVVLVLSPTVTVTGHQSATVTTAPTSGSPQTVSVTGSGGKTVSSVSDVGVTGTVNVADYSSDPAPGASGVTFATGTASYFDVSVANAGGTSSSTAQLTVAQCTGVTAGEDIYWLDGSTWKPVSPVATYDATSGCLSVVLSSTSSPTLSQLTGTVFAAAMPVVTGGGGGGGGYVATAPLVTGISPSGGPAAGGTVVTITGTGFTGATAVDFGSNAATDVTVESDTQIQASSPAGTGTVDVTVTTPEGTSATSTADQFTYAAAAPTPKTVTFSDVPASYWAYADIEQLAGKGIISGFPNGTFQPNGDVTRAQFVKMLVLTLGMAPGTGTTRFSDVAPSAWYAPYVSVAVQAGIVDGVSPTRFDPNGTLTREEMAVLLARALKLTKMATLKFTDAAQIGSWAVQGVEETVAAGYIGGFPNGTFQPLGMATRAQAAKVLAEVLSRAS